MSDNTSSNEIPLESESKAELLGCHVNFIPLGGIGEIGKNMYAYEFDGSIIVVDCGMLFPEEEMFGVDLVIPDITYLLENKDRVLGIVLTHGHEDHIGALPWVVGDLGVPIYGTGFTLGLVKRKLADYKVQCEVELNEIDEDSVLELGPFTIQCFAVTHSIPDTVGLIIDTPAGRIIHTGDYKIDVNPLSGRRMDIGKLAAACANGVLALVSDVTNAGDEGAGSIPKKS